MNSERQVYSELALMMADWQDFTAEVTRLNKTLLIPIEQGEQPKAFAHDREGTEWLHELQNDRD